MQESQWSPERIQTLRSLLAGGASAREVACELNTTRKAVIGKARRLGVAMSDNAPSNYQSGERPKDFDARVLAYIPFFRKFAGRIGVKPQDREDFVNEVITVALDRWRNYRADGNFYGWLYFQARCVRRSMDTRKDDSLEIEKHDVAVAATQESDADAATLVRMLSAHRFGDRAMLHAAGFIMPEIAERFGVSKQRIEQQIRIVERDFRCAGYGVAVGGQVAA